MKNDITFVQYSPSVLVNDKKVAKLYKDKVGKLSALITKELNILNTANSIATNSPVYEEKKPVAKSLDSLGMTGLYGFKTGVDERVAINGARKLKVNPIVTVSVKASYNGSEKQEVTKAVKNSFVEQPNLVMTELEKPVDTLPPANSLKFELPREKEISSVDVVTNHPYANGSSSVVSVDDYLQKSSSRDDNAIIVEQLTRNNEQLKSRIVESKSVVAQLEQQLTQIHQAKVQEQIDELKEEKLSYTATLEGLTDKIRILQEEINKNQSSSMGRKAM